MELCVIIYNFYRKCKLDKIKNLDKPKKRKTFVLKNKETIGDIKFEEIKSNIENRDIDAENEIVVRES